MQITWKRTWPDRDNDGTATTDALPGISARVYLENGGRLWYWFVNGKAAISRGQEKTKDAAKSAVEAEFRRLSAKPQSAPYRSPKQV
ncbi:ATPase [Roseibium alexandrii]|uniref:ATPase n=1 Tax=Roseibium alexandrii TaxID=388408 RepID=UPI0037523EF6